MRDKQILDSILHEYGLWEQLQIFIRTNDKANHNPYHNLDHALRTMSTAKLLLPPDLAPVTRTVLLAAMWHDWGHPGLIKARPDKENTAKAAAALLYHCADDPDAANAAHMIRQTTFPFEGDYNYLTEAERVLRDADIWSATYKLTADRIFVVYVGLAKEMDKSFSNTVDVTVEFLEQLPRLSLWAKAYADTETLRVKTLLDSWQPARVSIGGTALSTAETHKSSTLVHNEDLSIFRKSPCDG